MAGVSLGVVQLLTTVNAAARRSHLNRIAIPVRNFTPRLLGRQPNA